METWPSGQSSWTPLAIRSGYTQTVHAGGSGNHPGMREMSAGDLLEIQLER